MSDPAGPAIPARGDDRGGGLLCPVRVSHINILVEDFDAAVDHFRRVFDAEFILDLPGEQFHAGLVAFGGVIFELFSPAVYLLNARYGHHYIGLEYQADAERVREVMKARNIRIVRDVDIAVHTHPTDTCGVAFEFYKGSFHDQEWPMIGGYMKSASFWRDEHPLGIEGLYGYSIAVADIEPARRFLREVMGAKEMAEGRDAALNARVIKAIVADTVVELMTPEGAGGLQDHLNRFGDGMRSTILGIADPAAAKRHLSDAGLRIVPGSDPDRFAVAEEDNLGILFEFTRSMRRNGELGAIGK